MRAIATVSGTIASLAIAVLIWATQTVQATRDHNRYARIDNEVFGVDTPQRDWAVYANIADLAQMVAIGAGLVFVVSVLYAVGRYRARPVERAPGPDGPVLARRMHWSCRSRLSWHPVDHPETTMAARPWTTILTFRNGGGEAFAPISPGRVRTARPGGGSRST